MSTNIEVRHERVPMNRLLLVYDDPKVRPPVLEEMLPDLERLMGSLAAGYIDKSCQSLHFEELMGEGRRKLAAMLAKNWLVRCATRAKFFGAFKLAFKRHLASLVLKYRYTQKRTGTRPPPRHTEFTGHEQVKNIEVSLDDPESGVQLADREVDHEDSEWHEIVEECSALLTPDELAVFNQLVQPNDRARLKAQEDAWRGLKPGDPCRIKIQACHLAYGLGRKLDIFNEDARRVEDKLRKYRAMNDEEREEYAHFSMAVSTLAQLFGVQVPRNTENIVIRRMFTIAARHQIKKVFDAGGRPNAQIVELLQLVGAKVPKLHGDMLGCYGVLYSEYDRRCGMCDLRRSCETEAANVGLDKITLSPKLLGARQVRIPVILPGMPGDAVPATPDTQIIDSARDLEIIHYLNENFHRFNSNGEIYYRYRDNLSTRKLFCIGAQAAPLRLRFCNPVNELKALLVYERKAYYVPDNTAVAKVIELIDRHSEL